MAGECQIFYQTFFIYLYFLFYKIILLYKILFYLQLLYVSKFIKLIQVGLYKITIIK